ncbi:MAG: hypothetical protein ACKPGI_05765, partial [Verrucomicrobiota bacterium]
TRLTGPALFYSSGQVAFPTGDIHQFDGHRVGLPVENQPPVKGPFDQGEPIAWAMRPNHSRTGPSQDLVDGTVYSVSKSLSQRLGCFGAVFLLCGGIPEDAFT